MPQKIGRGILAWIPAIWRPDDETLLQIIGIDSLFLLRFLRMGMILTIVMSIFGVGVLLPINYTQGNLEYIPKDLNEFQMWYLSLFHVDKPKILSIHVGFTYFFSVIVVVMIWLEFKQLIAYRQRYYSSEEYQSTMRARTLMVTRVPQDLQSDQALGAFMFDRCGSHYPTEVSIARRLGKLPELVQKHEQAVHKLEQVLANWLIGPSALAKPRPRIKVKGQMVDAIDYYTQIIEELEYGIRAAREEIVTFRPTGVGFVSFDKPLHAHIAKQELKKKIRPMRVTLAPSPEDIIWSNAQMSVVTRRSRSWIGRLLSIVFTCVAFAPLSGFTFIADINNIRSLWPKTDAFFNEHKTLANIWQTTVAPVFLVIYYIAVPYVFRYISRYQGIPTSSAVERSVFKKMYVFYIVANVAVFTVASTIFKIVGSDDNRNTAPLGSMISLMDSNYNDDVKLYGTPTAILRAIVNNISTKNGFWTSYVSLKGVTAMMELAQILSFVIVFFRRYTRQITPREHRKVTSPPDTDLAVVYALYSWIFTICMVYAVYAPIIMPFGFINYLLAYWAYKYVLMYVYQTRHETAGEMARSVLNRMFVALFLFQLYQLTSLKVRLDDFTWFRPQNVYAYALVSLPVLTLAVAVWINLWSRKKFKYMEATAQNESYPSIIDKLDKQGSIGDRFIHPIFSQRLITPLVDKRVRHLLPQVYRGRIDLNEESEVMFNFAQSADVGTISKSQYDTAGSTVAPTAVSTARGKPPLDGAYDLQSNDISPGSTLADNNLDVIELLDKGAAHNTDEYYTKGLSQDPLLPSRRSSFVELKPATESQDNLLGAPVTVSRVSTKSSRAQLLDPASDSSYPYNSEVGISQAPAPPMYYQGAGPPYISRSSSIASSQLQRAPSSKTANIRANNDDTAYGGYYTDTHHQPLPSQRYEPRYTDISTDPATAIVPSRLQSANTISYSPRTRPAYEGAETSGKMPARRHNTLNQHPLVTPGRGYNYHYNQQPPAGSVVVPLDGSDRYGAPPARYNQDYYYQQPQSHPQGNSHAPPLAENQPAHLQRNYTQMSGHSNNSTPPQPRRNVPEWD
ncbi:hypothetical protein EV182_001013 [Spiromyces aspiralis]|uniref:Uncharacterized protein n=1 Tax=Spiromyces aspiralis TaxID=68401 RepID=A0ACC1HZS8_9FUNG|nr:hypothetical protein EV182_001013 [Spiromyces aspiralis]